MSIIVCEGADGTGKTTLARILEQRGFKYTHNGPPPEGVTLFEHYTQQLLDARGRDVVFDRLHVGELIYGPVMRGKSLITVEELRLLNRLLFSLGAKIIFCDTDATAIEKNWLARRGAEYIDDADKLWQVCHKYRELFDQEFFSDDMYVYDYQSVEGQFLIKNITGIGSDTCPPGVIGRPNNRFLLVGERSNGPADGPDLPFYTMDNSSGFLNRCLWDAGYKEHELAFTNARRLDGTPRDLYELYHNKPDQRIITLGKVAQQACYDQAVPHLEAPHPSYVKRFESKKRKNYVELLNRLRGEL